MNGREITGCGFIRRHFRINVHKVRVGFLCLISRSASSCIYYNLLALKV